MNASAKANVLHLRTNEQKWGPDLMAVGWTAIPIIIIIIIENQKELGLTPVDMCIVLHLASKWWTADSKPFPAKATIASALGIYPRTVQRRIAAMERARLIRREQRRTPTGSKTNIYHFDGLIESATPYAIEKRYRAQIERFVVQG